ncbi:hypothetical protein Bbelb_025140 [Branchiostoma belcheri]|nr:hypothetical protein Bbelb_025140 [Branchiostoma belcheri]
MIRRRNLPSVFVAILVCGGCSYYISTTMCTSQHQKIQNSANGATTTYGKERILAKPRFVNQTQPIEDGPPNIKMKGNDRQQANKDNITRPTNLENTTSSANVVRTVEPQTSMFASAERLSKNIPHGELVVGITKQDERRGYKERIKKSARGASFGNVTITDLDYADDVAILAEIMQALHLALHIMDSETRPLGLQISWQKTKVQSLSDTNSHLPTS